MQNFSSKLFVTYTTLTHPLFKSLFTYFYFSYSENHFIQEFIILFHYEIYVNHIIKFYLL